MRGRNCQRTSYRSAAHPLHRCQFQKLCSATCRYSPLVARIRFFIDPSLPDEEIALRILAISDGISVEEARKQYGGELTTDVAADEEADRDATG